MVNILVPLCSMDWIEESGWSVPKSDEASKTHDRSKAEGAPSSETRIQGVKTGNIDRGTRTGVALQRMILCYDRDRCNP